MGRPLRWYTLAMGLGLSILVNIVLFNYVMREHHLNLTKIFRMKRQYRIFNERATNPYPEATPTPYFVWSFNATATDLFRVEVELETKTQQLFIMTQKNVELNSSVKFEAEEEYFNITEELYSWLPRDQPFVDKPRFKTCSVVGNSAILLNSSCGAKIDSADFVIRTNLPPMENYTHDVGTKTNFVTANPSILRDKFNRLKSEDDRRAFLQYIEKYQDAYIFFSAFTYRHCPPWAFEAYRTIHNATGKTSNATVVFGHPYHLWVTSDYWRGNFQILERRLTSGLFLVSAALSLCEETRLYGFWPFDNDREGRRLTYHYYDNITMSPRDKMLVHHSLPAEFELLQKLHKRGVLHMTTDKCSSDEP